MAVTVMRIGLERAQPLRDPGIVRAVAGPEIEYVTRSHIAVDDMADRRCSVQRGNACFDRRDFGGAREVGLGQQNAIRHGDLPARLGLAFELRHAMQSIHRGDDAVQPAGIGGVLGGEQRVRHRGGVGEAGCLDRDTAERRQGAGLATLPKQLQRIGDVAAHGAADAAILQQHGILDRLLDQQVVQPDRAELVDDHRGVGQRRQLQQAVQQRRLAAAQEAGDDRHRHRVRRTIRCHANWLAYPFRGREGTRGGSTSKCRMSSTIFA